jgi:hypothetical protein
MFILQFYIKDISITLYTWLFLVPSRKQVIDYEESKMRLYSLDEVHDLPDSKVVQKIYLHEYSQVGTNPTAEVKLLCCFS